MTTDSASLIQEGPATMFSATVRHFTGKDRQGIDLNEILAGSAIQSDKELTRMKIEHGPNEYPGLDVTVKSGTSVQIFDYDPIRGQNSRQLGIKIPISLCWRAPA